MCPSHTCLQYEDLNEVASVEFAVEVGVAIPSLTSSFIQIRRSLLINGLVPVEIKRELLGQPPAMFSLIDPGRMEPAHQQIHVRRRQEDHWHRSHREVMAQM